MKAKCINCGKGNRRTLLLVQVCVPSEDTDPTDQNTDAWEHDKSVPICRVCLKLPVIAMTLAKTISGR
jgi:hypothetical protein